MNGVFCFILKQALVQTASLVATLACAALLLSTLISNTGVLYFIEVASTGTIEEYDLKQVICITKAFRINEYSINNNS